MSARCSSCPAEVRWVVLRPKGNRTLIDATARDDGNIEMTGRTIEDPRWGPTPEAKVLTAKQRASPPADLFDERPRYVSHFATCPNAEEFRRARS